jgi:hypothetical protein
MVRNVLLVPLRVLCSVLIALPVITCGHHTSTEPTTAKLRLVYQDPSSFPQNPNTTCEHRFGPAFLRVDNDWSESASLEPLLGATHSGELSRPGPGDHWIYVLDYRLCGVHPNCPTPTDGVSLDGIRLTRQITARGILGEPCIALSFHIDSRGNVSP